MWFHLWGVPELPSKVSVEFSTRMTHALGRCPPDRAIIRLVAENLLNKGAQRWRCAACVDAGLDERLEIRSVPRGREGVW